MNCVIIGTGVSGQVASLVLKRFGHQVTAIGPDTGDFFKGGLKYFHWSRHFLATLCHHGVNVDFKEIHGGIYWAGKILPYPEMMGRVRDRAEKIQRMHYAKTRGTLDGWTAKCMNDPGKDHSKSMVINPSELSKAALEGVRLCTDMVVEVDHTEHAIKTKSGNFNYDMLFTSAHASVFAAIGGLDFPDLRNGNIALYEVTWNGNQKWAGPDYIYTPAQKVVSRISYNLQQRSFWAEVPQPHGVDDSDQSEAVAKDVIHVLGIGMRISKQGRIKGHIIGCDEGLEYPEGVIPIGRYAAWDSRETTDVVAEKVGRWCDGIW